jgi:hypothetical protein
VAKLTARQVAGIVKAVGPPSGTTVAEWVQVAKDESSYRTDALSVTGCCRGLWQVNVRVHLAKIGVQTVAQGHGAMSDGVRNFQVAKVIYQESKSWRPWDAVRGAKPVVSAEARAAAANPDMGYAVDKAANPTPAGELFGAAADIVTSPVDAALSGIKALVDVVNRVGSWVSDPHNWTRTGYVVGGVALVIAAGAAVASETRAGQTVVAAGTKAATKGLA